ncbi:MAG: hypothetical protein ABW189_06245 [Rickettsiales bacterium]
MLDLTPYTPGRAVLLNAQRARDGLSEVTRQISSGAKHADLSGYAGDGNLQTILSLQSSIKEANGYIRSNANASAKLDVVDQSLDNLEGVAKELASLATNRLNGASGEDMPVEQVADGFLSRIQNALNVTYNGSFLFGGSKNDRPPVENINYTSIVGGKPTANYYNGDNFVATVRSSANQEVAYGVKADEQPFQTLIGAVHQLIEGHQANDPEKLNAALDLANDAVSQLSTKRAVVRQNADQLQTINVTQEDVALTLQANFTDLHDTDIVEASTRLSDMEALVQASYSAWATLSKLRLSNYLR